MSGPPSPFSITLLTARGDAIDVVAGLECGADDYVVKPVEPRVLDARIKAVLRRATPISAQETVVRMGRWSSIARRWWPPGTGGN